MALRNLAAADIGPVARIEAASYPVDSWSPDAFDAAVAAPRTYVCRVATDGDRTVVGYAVVSVAADQCDLQNLTVRTDWRRRGIARRLLQDVLYRAARRGAAECFLEVRHDNAAAIALYESHGFTESGRRPDYYARDVHAIVMSMILPPDPTGSRP